MGWLIEPGFFSNGPVHTALIIGAVAAIVSGIVGLFTVLRGQSFAGHALTDVSTGGGSLAFLIGISPVLGFVVFGLAGAGVMDGIGIRRVRGRDLATGIVLGTADGLAALFLHFDTTSSATTGATQEVLFGSLFAVSTSIIPLVVGLGVLAVGVVAVLYRPLLLSCVADELAAARGVPTRLVGAAFMGSLALAVGLSSVAIGTILSTALLIGPPATALRITRSPGTAALTACVAGVAATWIGILLAYDSANWFSDRRGLPVSFFIVVVMLALYLLSGLASRRSNGRRAQPAAPTAELVGV